MPFPRKGLRGRRHATARSGRRAAGFHSDRDSGARVSCRGEEGTWNKAVTELQRSPRPGARAEIGRFS